MVSVVPGCTLASFDFFFFGVCSTVLIEFISFVLGVGFGFLCSFSEKE